MSHTPRPAHARPSEQPGDTSAQRLERTIREGLVRTVFQPIVDLQHGEIAAFESLTRPVAESGFPDPGELFNAAEAHGQLWSLEEITRTSSLNASAGWPDGVLLFLNTTPQVFADPRFAHDVARAVREVEGLTPGRVVLEVTEKSEQQLVEGLDEQVRLVKQYGFQVAIDDVGAGASGMNRIMNLRPHWLKLDRQLVADIDRDRVRQNLIRFFVHFARLSGVKLVAEGIERSEELSTLISLGVPFGQGYYLAKPGSREQTIDAELATWMRRAWENSTRACYRDPNAATVARLAREVRTVDSASRVADVAGMLLREPTLPGVAVVDKGRFVGFCDRDSVLRAAGDHRAGQALGFLVVPDPVTLTPTTSVSEALVLASSRDDRASAQPVIVLEEASPGTRAVRVAGMIPVRDLLHAAADLANEARARTAPLTGLPGRVRADEHLRTLLGAGAVREQAAGRAPDIAFVDIRRFTDFNGAFGYDLGDQMLRQLVGMVQRLVVRNEPDVFFAHLGDDRFLVTAPADVLDDRLQELAATFDREMGLQFPLEAQMAEEETSASDAVGVSLRVLLVRNAALVASAPRDVYRLADRIRRGAAEPEHAPDQAHRAAWITVHDASLAGQIFRLRNRSA